MPAIIQARLAHPPKIEWTGKFFPFLWIGYSDPYDLILAAKAAHPWYDVGGKYENWYYLNANGYAQRHDTYAVPSKESPIRVILVPTYESEIYQS